MSWRTGCKVFLMGLSFVACLQLAGVLFVSLAMRTLMGATPWTYFHFVMTYGHDPKISKLAGLCAFLAGIPFIVLLYLIFRPGRVRPYGNAHWASEPEIREGGLRAKNGLLLGRCNGQYLVAGGTEHVLCFAPTRSGKGVGLVVPNLLNWPGSAVVHDIKGENFQITSGFRARHGQKVYFWNPGDPEGRTHCYNPLEFISSNPGQRIDDIQKIAHLILPEHEFWTNEARTLFVGLALYLIENSTLSFGLILRTVRGQGNFVEYVSRLLDTHRQAMNPVAYMALNAFKQKADKEQSAVLSTLNAALELWANPLIDAATSKSDFDLRNLRKERMTVYVGVSPSNLHRLRPLMQVFYQQAIDMMTDRQPDDTEPHHVLFLMDEFPSLGKMSQFEQGIAYLAGYHVRLFLIVQDIPQLETHYQRSGMNIFMGNSKVRITFAANNIETAELISKLVGTFGMPTSSVSETRKMGFSLDAASRSDSHHDVVRPLLLPQEILQLPKDQEIVLVESTQPILAKKIRYYKESVFKARLLPPIAVPKVEADTPIVMDLSLEELSEDEVQEVLNEMESDDVAAAAANT